MLLYHIWRENLKIFSIFAFAEYKFCNIKLCINMLFIKCLSFSFQKKTYVCFCKTGSYSRPGESLWKCSSHLIQIKTTKKIKLSTSSNLNNRFPCQTLDFWMLSFLILLTCFKTSLLYLLVNKVTYQI